MLNTIIAAVAGGLTGGLIRRGTPYFLGRKDKAKPFNWPWVEVTSALALILLVTQAQAYETWIIGATFCFFLMALSASDFLCKLVPTPVAIAGTAMGVLLTTLFPKGILVFHGQLQLLQMFPASHQMELRTLGLIISLLGALTGFLTLEFLRRTIGSMTRMEVMGMGDSFILMMIGAYIGPSMVLLSILPASLIGVLIGLYFKWVKGSPHSPFGPALALGGWLQFLFWQRLDQSINQFYGFFYTLPSWMMSVFGFTLLVILFLLILRIKTRASEYAKLIDEDYKSIEEELED